VARLAAHTPLQLAKYVGGQSEKNIAASTKLINGRSLSAPIFLIEYQVLSTVISSIFSFKLLVIKIHKPRIIKHCLISYFFNSQYANFCT
jgi:hypothetical protein